MKQYLKKYSSSFIFIIACLFSIILTLYVSTTFKLDDTKFKSNNVEYLKDNWYIIEDNNKVYLNEFTRENANKKDGLFTIYYTFPNDLDSNMVVCITTKNEYVKAYIDDELIYEYGYNNVLKFKTELGAILNQIELPSASAGKTLKLELDPMGGRTGKAPYSVILGTYDSICLEITRTSTLIIIAALVMVFTSIVFIIMGIIKLITRRDDGPQILYFGIFCLISACWTLTDSLLLQIVFNNKMVSFIIFNFSFLLMPIPFTLCAKHIYKGYEKFFNISAIVMTLYFFLRFTLYLLGILNFESGLYIIHLMMGIVITFTLYCCIKTWNNMSHRYISIGIGCMATVDILSLIIFWSTDKLNYNRYNFSTFFFIGIFIYIIIFVIGVIRRAFYIHNQAMQTEYYEKCAYTDELTKLDNRASYERDMDRVDDRIKEIKSLTFMLLDLNNLKKTNDNYGHEVGDRIIIALGNCLNKVYGGVGKVYRIGGDEMVVTIVDASLEDILNLNSRFEFISEEYNLLNKNKIDYAFGYVYINDFSNLEGSARKYLRQADENMYKNKALKKKKGKKYVS